MEGALKKIMEEKKSISRRTVIKGIGLGVAALAVTSAKASDKEKGKIETLALEDPINKYPKPPFKSQSQPWPGLAGKMDPVPDHGGKSNKGSGRLAGRKALITGGGSGM